MQTTKQLSGFRGESIAADFIKERGYKIIERNFRTKSGEIDIIALDKNTLVFIEVKTRSTAEFGSPLEAITSRKMNSLIRTAEFYKIKHPNLPQAMRIDAVAISLNELNAFKSIELVQNISV